MLKNLQNKLRTYLSELLGLDTRFQALMSENSDLKSNVGWVQDYIKHYIPYYGVLCDKQIREYIKRGDIVVEPYDESLINPGSLDISLGDMYTNVQLSDDNILGVIDPLKKHSFKDHLIPNHHEFVLHPGQFVLVNMLEELTLPPNVCAKIFGKSSLGRLGLLNSGQAGFIDQNWSGSITMELYNTGPLPIKLTKGMKIGQLIFFQTMTPDKSYKETGRYYKQNPGQGSKGL